MSLKRNLKTYLIAAVILLMGGLAVGTVATASQPDSYLTIQKKWQFIDANGEEVDETELLEGETITVEIKYYELNELGERIGDLETEIAKIGKDTYRNVGVDWSWGLPSSDLSGISIDADVPIDVVSVKEIECSKEIGDYILVDTQYDWNDHIQASNKVKIEKYQIGSGENVRSSLITLEKDVADFEDGIDKYTYIIKGPDGYEKTVELTRENPKKVVDVNEYTFENGAAGEYTVTAVGGGTVTLTVSDNANIEGAVAAGEGFYAEEGSTITVKPADAEEGKIYHYSVASGDETIATGETNGNGAEVSIAKSGTYKVKLTANSETSDLQDDADDPEKDPDDESEKKANENASLPKDTSGNEKDPAGEDGTTNGDNAQDATSEGEGNAPTGSEAGNTSGEDNVNISDEPAPLTNVLPEEDKQFGNTEETLDDESKQPVDSETPKDSTDGESAEGKGQNTPDAITSDGDNKPAETPVASDAPGADENLVVAVPTAEGTVEVETTAFTVAYSYNKTLEGESIKNIKKTSGNMRITATIAANEGTEAPADGWVYTLTGEGVEAQPITLNVGGEGTDLTDLMTEGVLYSLSYEGGCKVSYGNLDVTITNVYKPKGAYNIVHEYYVNEISPENFEGRSSITIKNDAVGNEMTAEKLLAKNIVEPELTFTPTEGPSTGNEDAYEYEYKPERNAYGIGSRDGESGLVSGNDVNADEGIAVANEMQDENAADKKTDSTEWEPVKNYEEEKGKAGAIVQKEGNEVVILKYVRTTDPDDPEDPPKDPEDPKDPPKDPETPPDLPDPNDPESPPTITITDDDVPRTYVRVWDSEKEEWVYLPEDEVPLAGRTSAKTADGMAPVFWIFMAGLSVAGVGVFHYNKKKKEE